MSYGSVDGGLSGRVDACVCMSESLWCSPETIIALLIGYTPRQSKTFIKNLKKNKNISAVVSLCALFSSSSPLLLCHADSRSCVFQRTTQTALGFS